MVMSWSQIASKLPCVNNAITNDWSWSKLSLVHTSIIFSIIQATESNTNVNNAVLWFLHLRLNVNTG